MSDQLPKNGKFATTLRRVVLFEKAKEAVGGEALATALGISRRAVTYKTAIDRSQVSNLDLLAAAAAVLAEGESLIALARDLRIAAGEGE